MTDAMPGMHNERMKIIPFCENCDQWYKDKELVGGVNSQVSENFLHLLQSEQFSKAGKLLAPLHGFHSPSLEVSLQRCPSCRVSDLLLTVNAISLDSKGKVQAKEVVQGMLSLSQYYKFREAVAENLPQSREENVGTTEEEMRLAQLERSMMLASDRFEPHGLSVSEEANLVQQLSRYPQIKEAYLVRKTLQYFPEKPLYVLGIMRGVGWLESEQAEPIFRKKLMTELTLPNQTWITCLNKDKLKTIILQKTAGKAIYQKK